MKLTRYLSFASFLVASSLCSAQAAPKIVFIGDATTADWTVMFRAHRTWVNKGQQGANNRGQTALTVLERFQRDVVDLHPAAVHIWIGLNDAELVHDATIAFWQQAYEDQIDSMVKMSQAAGIKVILGMIPPDLTFLPGTVFHPDVISTINAFLANYGATHNIPVINYHDVLCGCVGATAPTAGGDTVVYGAANQQNPLLGGSSGVTQQGFDRIQPLLEDVIATVFLTLKGGYIDNPGSINTFFVGHGTTFAAYGRYSDGVTRPMTNTTYAGANGTWTSTNPTVATVTQTGVLQPFTAGVARIEYVSPTGQTFSPWDLTVESQPCPSSNGSCE